MMYALIVKAGGRAVFDHEALIYAFSLKKAKVRGYNLMSSCPLGTHKDSHPSFGINLYTGEWNCYSCGERGTNIRTLAYKMSVLLPDDLMMQSLLEAPAKPSVKVFQVFDCMDDITQNPEKAHEELAPRGISLAALKRFKVGYRDGSICFPCVLPDKNMYGWVERNTAWAGRYGYFPQNVMRSSLLFGMDRIIPRVFLSESMTDTLKLITWHVEAVSTCGNRLFDRQAKLIIENCGEVVLVPQRDDPASLWVESAKQFFAGKIRVSGVVISQIPYTDDFGENKVTKDIGHPFYTKDVWEDDVKKIRFLY